MSFSQEIKDFLTGYKTVREMGQTDDKGKLDREKMDADKAYQDALLELRGQELDIQRQRLAQSAAGAGRSGPTELQLAEDARRQEKHDAEMEKFGLEIEGMRGTTNTSRFDSLGVDPGAGTGQALPTGNPTGNPVDMIVRPEPEPQPVMAEGGLVPEKRGDRRNRTPATTPAATALPTGLMPDNVAGTIVPSPEQSAPPTALPSPVTPGPAMPRPGQPTTAEAPTAPAAPAGTTSPTRNEVSPEAIHIVVSRGREAIEDGLKAIEKSFAVPRSALNTTDADPLAPEISMQEVEDMRNTVDPNGDIHRNLVALATAAEAHRYFISENEPEKAANALKHYILGERRASQTQGVLAMNALKEGNLPEACQLINNACERFPTAHEILVTPGEGGLVNYSVKEAGEVLEQGTISANQMMELTGLIADGSLFMNSLVNFVESTTPPAQEMPSRALNAFADAQSIANQATLAWTDSKQGGTPEGDPALLAAAQEARAKAGEARARALDLGWKPSDLNGILNQDETLAPLPQGNTLKPASPEDLQRARQAIAGGAPVADVVKRLEAAGFSAEGL